jgi:threonine/homoserine/homoserine lactone efflux protein
MSALNYLIPGITFGVAAAAQPGPLMIYLISRSLQSGWRRTLPGIFAPLISDGPIAVVCLLFLGSLPQVWLQYIQITGGFFILYLAFRAARTWTQDRGRTELRAATSRRTLFDATVVNFLNPGPYLGWSLVIGPLFLKGWKEGPVNGVALLAGFYLTMFLVTAVVIVVFALARERGRGLQRTLLVISAVVLALFGLYQIFSGIRGL